jgi:protein-disulfide isomerase
MFKKTKLFILSSLLFLFALNVHAESVNELLHQANDPVAGNPQANVTVVEFFDYQCSYCIDMAPVIDTIIKTNPNVRVVFKEFPIRRGSVSEVAARAALAANKQGKYLAFHHALLAADQPLTRDAVLTIAKKVGLNVNQLKKDMQSASVTNQINKNHQLAERLNVSGTPAFFIGNTQAQNMDQLKFVLGEMSQSDLQQAIDNANK